MRFLLSGIRSFLAGFGWVTEAIRVQRYEFREKRWCVDLDIPHDCWLYSSKLTMF